MKYFDKKVRKLVIDHIVSTKSKIEVQPGKCRMNFKCQFNSVHDALKKGQDRVAMTVYIEDDWPIIHFINVNKKGKFTDNTLGYWSNDCEFYLIKYIEKEHFHRIDDIFGRYRNELRRLRPFYLRLFSNYKC